MIVLMQQISADFVVRAMRRQVAGAAIGVGMVRAGLAGAAASIVDAREALALANHGQKVAFQDQWLLATVLPRFDRFASILESCRETARTHPDLADTIRVFASNGFSLTATARVLHIHPNTVKYRLSRWHELAGRDVHTWQGLSDSMVALTMPASSQS
jgi:DNA-binding PucR family transcriptional regulator